LLTAGENVATRTFVRARVDEAVRNEAAAALAEVGLTVSDLIRITLTRVAKEGALPAQLKVPNATTRGAMEEARAAVQARQKARALAPKTRCHSREGGNPACSMLELSS